MGATDGFSEASRGVHTDFEKLFVAPMWLYIEKVFHTTVRSLGKSEKH
jgi:hypothetical protein